MIMDKKIKYLVVLVAIIIIVIITGTFAWLTFRSNKTAMVLTIGDLNDAVVTLQPYQINTSIVPNTTFSEPKSVVVNVEAKNNTNVNKKVRLYYRINEIDEEDFRYRITRKKDDESSFTVYLYPSLKRSSIALIRLYSSTPQDIFSSLKKL